MTVRWFDLLHEAERRASENVPVYFIAHLFDRVLAGYVDDEQDWPKLRRAAENNRILELHMFNYEKEVYAVWENGQVVRYEDLVHPEVSAFQNENNKEEEEPYAEYRYELEQRFSGDDRNPRFDTLVVRVYWEFGDNEEEYCMPKIAKTVLYALEGGNKGESSR